MLTQTWPRVKLYCDISYYFISTYEITSRKQINNSSHGHFSTKIEISHLTQSESLGTSIVLLERVAKIDLHCKETGRL